ncbi:unnamed protein product [Clavelina lepadiformis]|uniref:UBZ1-type domain-containing protein n=2 Tax=Clavelina lepadiformis TaxID=159417 RepID=A0ABP0FTC8_CLALP
MESNLASTPSLRTEDDYSIISRPHQASMQCFNAFNMDERSPTFGTSGNFSSPLRSNSPVEAEQLYMSHHALGLAYDHMKQKLSELELTNKSLNRRLRSTPVMERSNTSSSSHDNEVTKAWEAYSEKCRECEKLRDDLRNAEQKLVRSQNEAREQYLREDMLRTQSQQQEYKKKLQQAELDLRDEQSKQEMAREELQKEKEYHEMVVQATKQRHEQMESTIAELQQALEDKVKQHQDLLQKQEYQRKQIQEIVETQQTELNTKLHEVEDKFLHERELRLKAEEELSKWRDNVEHLQSTSGLPLSMSQVHQNKLDPTEIENESGSEIDATELVNELQSLTDELTKLKRETSQHSLLLSRVCDDPRIRDSLMSVDCNGLSDLVLTETNPPPLVDSTFGIIPSFDNRQVVAASPGTSFDMSQSTRDCLPKVSSLAISREIHASESNATNDESSSSHTIQIPPVPNNLTSAFTNIRLAKSHELAQPPPIFDDTGDNLSSYYSTVTGIADERNHHNERIIRVPIRSSPDSLSSDSGTGSSNIDTMTEPTIAIPLGNNQARRMSPLGSPNEERVALRYPPNQQGMKAIWPTNKKNNANLSPLWPPSSSGSTASFEVITGHPSSPTYAPSSGLIGQQQQQARPQNQVVRHVPHDYPATNSLPTSHPSMRPVSRARNIEGDLLVVAAPEPMPRRRAADRTNSSSPEIVDLTGGEEERTFMTEASSGVRQCPMCSLNFGPNMSESSMSRHINSHFDDDN